MTEQCEPVAVVVVIGRRRQILKALAELAEIKKRLEELSEGQQK